MTSLERVDDFEPIGDLVAVFLARTWHRQLEGVPLPDSIAIDAEARRAHAAACREHNPDATDVQVAAYWDQLGDESRNAFRNGARLRLAEGATR